MRAGASSNVPGAIGSVPISGATAIVNIFQKDVSITPGAITALTGATVTATVTGLLTTDQVVVQCVSALTAGAIIANSRVSATNTLELTINTAVAVGVTMGALTFRVTVFR